MPSPFYHNFTSHGTIKNINRGLELFAVIGNGGTHLEVVWFGGNIR